MSRLDRFKRWHITSDAPPYAEYGRYWTRAGAEMNCARLNMQIPPEYVEVSPRVFQSTAVFWRWERIP